MNSTLGDLIDHQLWADAQHWEAIEAHAPAAADPAILGRLHHLHMAQRAFVWVVSDRSSALERSVPGSFASIADLRAFARGSHQRIVGCRDGVSDARRADAIEMPRWFGFKEPPLTITVGEALTQMAMHSQWHRGQNATRLRELGAQPPTVDLIAWYWKAGRRRGCEEGSGGLVRPRLTQRRAGVSSPSTRVRRSISALGSLAGVSFTCRPSGDDVCLFEQSRQGRSATLNAQQ